MGKGCLSFFIVQTVEDAILAGYSNMYSEGLPSVTGRIPNA